MMRSSTESLPVHFFTSSTAAAPRSAFLDPRYTWQLYSETSCFVNANPMPVLAPVTRMRLRSPDILLSLALLLFVLRKVVDAVVGEWWLYLRAVGMSADDEGWSEIRSKRRRRHTIFWEVVATAAVMVEGCGGWRGWGFFVFASIRPSQRIFGGKR